MEQYFLDTYALIEVIEGNEKFKELLNSDSVPDFVCTILIISNSVRLITFIILKHVFQKHFYTLYSQILILQNAL